MKDRKLALDGQRQGQEFLHSTADLLSFDLRLCCTKSAVPRGVPATNSPRLACVTPVEECSDWAAPRLREYTLHFEVLIRAVRFLHIESDLHRTWEGIPNVCYEELTELQHS